MQPMLVRLGFATCDVLCNWEFFYILKPKLFCLNNTLQRCAAAKRILTTHIYSKNAWLFYRGLVLLWTLLKQNAYISFYKLKI